MNDSRKEAIAAQLREAAATGSKAHVIYDTGKWIVFKEQAQKASAIFATKTSAIRAALKFLNSGQAEALVIHKKDGSVSRVLVA